jgi:hypothetical protein
MRFHTSAVTASISILVAFGAWAGVWYEYALIRELRIAHADALSQMQSKDAREAAQSRLRSLIVETTAARAELATVAKADVIESAKVIESVGPAAQVDIKVANATKVGRASSAAAAAAHQLHTVEYSVETTGQFQNVVKAAMLLDALPLPARVARFELSRDPLDPSGKSAPSWHLSARIHLLTDSDAL